MFFNLFKTKNKVKTDTKSATIEQLEILLKEIKVPLCVRELSHYDIHKVKTETLHSFEILEYSKFNQYELMQKLEWDSFIVSVAIYILQTESRPKFIEEKILNYFSEDIQNTKEQYLYNFIFDTLIKFRNSVNSLKKKEQLEKNIKWTALEIVMIYYFLYQKSK